MITPLLSNPGHPPKRRVKVNGTMSEYFTINCGVPQGCPFSPLAFLIIAEALTRLVKLSPTYTGMKIVDTEHRISPASPSLRTTRNSTSKTSPHSHTSGLF
jgi:hypothetical protein